MNTVIAAYNSLLITGWLFGQLSEGFSMTFGWKTVTLSGNTVTGFDVTPSDSSKEARLTFSWSSWKSLYRCFTVHLYWPTITSMMYTWTDRLTILTLTKAQLKVEDQYTCLLEVQLRWFNVFNTRQCGFRPNNPLETSEENRDGRGVTASWCFRNLRDAADEEMLTAVSRSPLGSRTFKSSELFSLNITKTTIRGS